MTQLFLECFTVRHSTVKKPCPEIKARAVFSPWPGGGSRNDTRVRSEAAWSGGFGPNCFCIAAISEISTWSVLHYRDWVLARGRLVWRIELDWSMLCKWVFALITRESESTSKDKEIWHSVAIFWRLWWLSRHSTSSARTNIIQDWVHTNCLILTSHHHHHVECGWDLEIETKISSWCEGGGRGGMW